MLHYLGKLRMNRIKNRNGMCHRDNNPTKEQKVHLHCKFRFECEHTFMINNVYNIGYPQQPFLLTVNIIHVHVVF